MSGGQVHRSRGAKPKVHRSFLPTEGQIGVLAVVRADSEMGGAVGRALERCPIGALAVNFDRGRCSPTLTTTSASLFGIQSDAGGAAGERRVDSSYLLTHYADLLLVSARDHSPTRVRPTSATAPSGAVGIGERLSMHRCSPIESPYQLAGSADSLSKFFRV